MNKIVRRHYPAENLPEDLRRELAGARDVTITIEAEEDDQRDRLALLEELFAARRPPFRTAEAINEDLRRDREDCRSGTPEEQQHADWFSRHENIRRNYFKSTEEVNDHVRSLRDERSHGER